MTTESRKAIRRRFNYNTAPPANKGGFEMYQTEMNLNKDMIIKYGVSLNNDRAIMLVKEASYEYSDKQVNTPKSIAKLFNEVFDLGNKAEEQFYMIAINTKGQIRGVFLVAHGDLSSTVINPREIYKRAVLCNAAAIALAHNHPSGDPTPSGDDITTTKKLVDAGHVLGVAVWDHLIIGEDGRYVSFREERLINN
jgi:DNA repair protein RadC